MKDHFGHRGQNWVIKNKKIRREASMDVFVVVKIRGAVDLNRAIVAREREGEDPPGFGYILEVELMLLADRLDV